MAEPSVVTLADPAWLGVEHGHSISLTFSTADICPVSAADICPVSTADICPVSTEHIYPVSTEDRTAAGRRPAAVLSSVETG